MNVITVEDMHYDYKLKIDKVDTLSDYNFNRAEIDWLLNTAQLRVLTRHYGLNNLYRTGFEGIQKRVDDLKNLVVKFPEQPALVPTPIEEGILEVDLSDLRYLYLHFIRAQGQGECGGIDLIHVQHDDMNEMLKDPFNSPSEDVAYFNFGRSSTGDSTSIYIYTLSLINTVKIEYIKEPVRIHYGGYTYIDGQTYPQQDCELANHIKPTIVDEAVSIAAGLIHDNKLNIALQRANTNE